LPKYVGYESKIGSKFVRCQRTRRLKKAPEWGPKGPITEPTGCEKKRLRNKSSVCGNKSSRTRTEGGSYTGCDVPPDFPFLVRSTITHYFSLSDLSFPYFSHKIQNLDQLLAVSTLVMVVRFLTSQDLEPTFPRGGGRGEGKGRWEGH